MVADAIAGRTPTCLNRGVPRSPHVLRLRAERASADCRVPAQVSRGTSRANPLAASSLHTSNSTCDGEFTAVTSDHDRSDVLQLAAFAAS
jgi:hypothetical protein